MSEGTTTHRPLSQDDWKFIFAVVEGTKLDVPRIRAEVAQLAAAEARAEQSDVLTDDMLRYAMAALGTNSPADADLYRAFWLHAITARKSNTALAEGGPRWADGGDAMAGAMAGM